MLLVLVLIALLFYLRNEVPPEYLTELNSLTTILILGLLIPVLNKAIKMLRDADSKTKELGAFFALSFIMFIIAITVFFAFSRSDSSLSIFFAFFAEAGNMVSFIVMARLHMKEVSHPGEH